LWVTSNLTEESSENLICQVKLSPPGVQILKWDNLLIDIVSFHLLFKSKAEGSHAIENEPHDIVTLIANLGRFCEILN